VDVLFGIGHLQKEQLGNDQVRHHVIDRGSQENDAINQQAGINIVTALAASGLLDHHRDKEILHKLDECRAQPSGVWGGRQATRQAVSAGKEESGWKKGPAGGKNTLSGGDRSPPNKKKENPPPPCRQYPMAGLCQVAKGDRHHRASPRKNSSRRLRRRPPETGENPNFD
jgi:hypothetical protein